MYERVKRTIDLAGATVLLLAGTPFLILAAVAVRVTMGPPVLYRQIRAGQRGKRFTLLKFRTMRPPGDGEPLIGSEAARLTRVGAWLRRTSIDELPQLWNVLRGEMSLVGPRPLLPQYLDRYSPEQGRRHEVLPGLTGVVQVNGRNELPWNDRLALDVWYVDHRCTWLDLSILARTALAIFSGRGARESHVASPEFVGQSSLQSQHD